MDNIFKLNETVAGWENAHAELDNKVNAICARMLKRLRTKKYLEYYEIVDAENSCLYARGDFKKFGAEGEETAIVCTDKIKQALATIGLCGKGYYY